MSTLPLQGWTVLSLRPRGQHAGLRAAAARQGAQLLALSPMRIAPNTDADSRVILQRALAADTVVFTSPNAVEAAHALQPLAHAGEQTWLGVGAGTLRALQLLGIDATAPARMDSEGLLALPALQALAGRTVGLVTAPGGRGLLADALVARGANLLRANVYTRVADTITPASWQRLSAALATPARTLLALSSGEALQLLLAQVPANLADALREARVVAASDRLAQLARDAGFAHVSTASSARPAALVSAGIDAFV